MPNKAERRKRAGLGPKERKPKWKGWLYAGIINRPVQRSLIPGGKVSVRELLDYWLSP